MKQKIKRFRIYTKYGELFYTLGTSLKQVKKLHKDLFNKKYFKKIEVIENYKTK